MLEPLASSYAVLEEEEREAGVVLVDIGGGTTDVAIMQDNTIRHTAVVAIAGQKVTDDIRIGLSVLEDQAEKLLPALPVTNGFRNNRFLGDHKRGDAELVDLLLHRQDRAYTVPQLAELVAGAGLQIASFIEPLRYDPSLYLTDPVLAKRTAALPVLEQAALAERLAGNMKLHIVYLTREADTVAQPAPEATPIFIEWEAATIARAVQQQGAIKGAFDGLPVTLPLPRQAPTILRLIDGTRRMDAIRQETGFADWDGFMAVFRPIWRALNGINRLVLRY